MGASLHFIDGTSLVYQSLPL